MSFCLQQMQDVYDCFYSMIDRYEVGMVLLDAPGGIGKTFLINLILAKKVRQH